MIALADLGGGAFIAPTQWTKNVFISCSFREIWQNCIIADHNGL